MVGPAARLYRILFQCPQTWCCFSGVSNPRFRSGKLLYEAPCHGSDTAKMRQEIQSSALAGKDRASAALDACDFRSRFDKRSIVVRKGNANLRVQRPKNLFGNR